MKAIIFDYGEVLCHRNDPAWHDMLALTALDIPTFESIYWRDRHQYDLGHFDGAGFWQRFGKHAGRTFTPDETRALIDADVRMWTETDPVMLAWVAALQKRGLRTAILSNMVPEVLHALRAESRFSWLSGFTHLTWSCELHIAKPDPAIYTYTCEQLGAPPADCLLIDDKPENIAAAEALGLQAIQFRDPDRLSLELARRNLLQDFPQPGVGPASGAGLEAIPSLLSEHGG
ncbi:MAG TPA: HAD family phosphatase [Acidobacteriaceae bacterium]